MNKPTRSYSSCNVFSIGHVKHLPTKVSVNRTYCIHYHFLAVCNLGLNPTTQSFCPFSQRQSYASILEGEYVPTTSQKAGRYILSHLRTDIVMSWLQLFNFYFRQLYIYVLSSVVIASIWAILVSFHMFWKRSQSNSLKGIIVIFFGVMKPLIYFINNKMMQWLIFSTKKLFFLSRKTVATWSFVE